MYDCDDIYGGVRFFEFAGDTLTIPKGERPGVLAHSMGMVM